MDNVWSPFFSHFFRERSFESRQNSRVDLFKAKKKKKLEGFKRPFFIYCSWVLCSMDCLQLPCIRVKEAVTQTQCFLARKFWLKNRCLFMTNKFERKCLQKFYVSSKHEKECFMKTTSYLEDFHKLLLSFVIDGLFITPVYSPRRARFFELSVSWQEKFGPTTNFIYDKQIWKQMFAEILRFK